MLLFIVIFFATVIVVGTAAVVGFSFFLKRRTRRLQSETSQKFIGDAPPYRSLFAPDEDELRLLERQESAERTAKAAEAARLSAVKKNQAVRDFQEIWASEPNKPNTTELFRLAAQSENAEVFSETAESVIRFRRENKIANLTSTDLADLLDSHFRTLPQQERTSGALFWIKREIETLRRKSE